MVDCLLQLCYAVTGMPQKASSAVVPRSTPTNGDETKEAEEKKKKEEEERAANDLKTRKRLQTFLDVRTGTGYISIPPVPKQKDLLYHRTNGPSFLLFFFVIHLYIIYMVYTWYRLWHGSSWKYQPIVLYNFIRDTPTAVYM